MGISPWRSMKTPVKHSPAFTIVELLIVVVVIAILAAITIVSYNGITRQAEESAMKSTLRTAANKLALEHTAKGAYPADIDHLNLDSGSYDLRYIRTDSTYCVEASSETRAYAVSGITGETREGTCSLNTALNPNLDCPAGFIQVPGDYRFGTSDFCVMKYEAKNSGGTAVSTASGNPWVNINQNTARDRSAEACDGCHLITEPEWMTIATNALSVASNWSGGAVGVGYLYNGHVNGNPGSPLAASSSDSDGMNGMTGGTGNGPEYNNRRTLTLTNGEVIWDLSGNVREWTDATIRGNQPGSSSAGSWQEWPSISNWGGLPPTSRPVEGTTSYSSSHGVGRIYASTSDADTRGFFRSGAWGPGSAGVLYLGLDYAPSSMHTNIGFRVAR